MFAAHMPFQGEPVFSFDRRRNQQQDNRQRLPTRQSIITRRCRARGNQCASQPNPSTAHCVTGCLVRSGGWQRAQSPPLHKPPSIILLHSVISYHHTGLCELQEILTGPTRQQYIHRTNSSTSTFPLQLSYTSILTVLLSSFTPPFPLPPPPTHRQYQPRDSRYVTPSPFPSFHLAFLP